MQAYCSQASRWAKAMRQLRAWKVRVSAPLHSVLSCLQISRSQALVIESGHGWRKIFFPRSITYTAWNKQKWSKITLMTSRFPWAISWCTTRQQDDILRQRLSCRTWYSSREGIWESLAGSWAAAGGRLQRASLLRIRNAGVSGLRLWISQCRLCWKHARLYPELVVLDLELGSCLMLD